MKIDETMLPRHLQAAVVSRTRRGALYKFSNKLMVRTRRVNKFGVYEIRAIRQKHPVKVERVNEHHQLAMALEALRNEAQNG